MEGVHILMFGAENRGFPSTLTCNRTSSESNGSNRGLKLIQPFRSSSMHSISRDNWSMSALGSSNPVEPKVCTMWGWESTSTMSASARKSSLILNFFMAKTPWEISLPKLLPSRPWQFSAQFDSVIENTGQPATWHRPAIRKEIYEEKGEAFDLGLLKMDTLRSATYYCLDEKHANNTWLANLNSGRSHFLHFCPIESFLFNQMIPIMLSIEPRAPSSNFWVVQSLVSTFVSGVFAY